MRTTAARRPVKRLRVNRRRKPARPSDATYKEYGIGVDRELAAVFCRPSCRRRGGTPAVRRGYSTRKAAKLTGGALGCAARCATLAFTTAE